MPPRLPVVVGMPVAVLVLRLVYLITAGIGSHNFTEGPKIGATYAVGELALGRFVVLVVAMLVRRSSPTGMTEGGINARARTTTTRRSAWSASRWTRRRTRDRLYTCPTARSPAPAGAGRAGQLDVPAVAGRHPSLGPPAHPCTTDIRIARHIASDPPSPPR